MTPHAAVVIPFPPPLPKVRELELELIDSVESHRQACSEVADAFMAGDMTAQREASTRAAAAELVMHAALQRLKGARD